MYGIIETSYIKRKVINMDFPHQQTVRSQKGLHTNPAQGEFKPHAAMVG